MCLHILAQVCNYHFGVGPNFLNLLIGLKYISMDVYIDLVTQTSQSIYSPAPRWIFFCVLMALIGQNVVLDNVVNYTTKE